MITFLITSKIQGNPNWGLDVFLESLAQTAKSHDSFEVLLKFDTEDEKSYTYVDSLNYPFHIKWLREPRGRGYIDIHIGYTRAMSMIDDKSKIITCFADDFIMHKQNWDEEILKLCDQHDDIFILANEKSKQSKNYNCDLNDLDVLYFDEGPFWSRRLLEITGGLGHVSFTDAWTFLLQYYLHHNHKLDITSHFTGDGMFERKSCFMDSSSHERWHTDRKSNFDFMKTNFYKTIVMNQANNIALNINSK